MIETIEYETLLSGVAFSCSAVLYPFENRQYFTLMFRGQKPTDYGHSRRNVTFLLSCRCIDMNNTYFTKHDNIRYIL